MQYHIKTNEKMARLVAVLGYLTIFGWLVALFLYGEHKSHLARFHLRQSLGLVLTAGLLSFIPLIGWGLNIILLFAWLLSIYHAGSGHIFRVPVLGDLYQEHLDFVI